MKWSSPIMAGLCLFAAGCGDAGSADSVDMNSPAAVARGMVSDFKLPILQGLVVANDPEGAVVISCQGCKSTPGTTLAGEYPAGTVFTEVNGVRVRDAAHFRDLTDGVFERREDLDLKYLANVR